MPNLSRKKLILLGFLFAVLLVIPLTVYLVQQQLEIRGRAEKNTTLSFTPPDQTTSIGDKANFEIWVSPGKNQVDFIKLVIKYDSTKLSATKESFVLNPASNLSILQGPVVGADDLSVALQVGADPTKVIQKDTKIGNITFDVIGPSELPTEISFDSNQIQIRSISTPDGIDENVFLTGSSATLTIQSEGQVSPTPGQATSTPTPTPTLITTPTPTSTSSGNGVTPVQNQAPVCETLILDKSSEGEAPYSVTFTVTGSDSDGTVSEVTFNFGDGVTEDVISGGGIGTASLSLDKSYTYQNSGTFTASAVIKDNSGDTSDSSSCTTTITVSGTGTGSATLTPLPPTGPTQTIVGLGALGGLLFLIGALLFFAL